MNSISRETHAMSHDLSQLAHHARALLTATADVASDQVVDAREQLAAVLKNDRHMSEHLHDRVNDGITYCRDTIRENPYQTLAIGLGIGLLLTMMLRSSDVRAKFACSR